MWQIQVLLFRNYGVFSLSIFDPQLVELENAEPSTWRANFTMLESKTGSIIHRLLQLFMQLLNIPFHYEIYTGTHQPALSNLNVLQYLLQIFKNRIEAPCVAFYSPPHLHRDKLHAELAIYYFCVFYIFIISMFQ